jgi:hypothetical protein
MSVTGVGVGTPFTLAVLSTTVVLYWTDPDTGLRVRCGQVGGIFVTQVELTVLGFAGTEDIDYITIDSHSGSLTGTYRETVISGNYVLEVGTSFSGTEGIDYEILISQ